MKIENDNNVDSSTPLPGTSQSKFAYLNNLKTPKPLGSAQSVKRRGPATLTPLSEMAKSKRFKVLQQQAAEMAARRASASLNASPIGSGASTPTPNTNSAGIKGKGGNSPVDSEEDGGVESDNSASTSSSSEDDESNSETEQQASQSRTRKLHKRNAKNNRPILNTELTQLRKSQSERGASSTSGLDQPNSVLSRRNTVANAKRQIPKSVRMAVDSTNK